MKGVDRPKRDSPFLATYDSIAAANAPQLQGGLLMQWLLERPADLFAELRDAEPIFATPAGVVVSRYDDVTTVAERDDVFGVAHYGESMRRYLNGGNFLLGMDDNDKGEFDRDRALLRLAIRRTDLKDDQRLRRRPCPQNPRPERGTNRAVPTRMAARSARRA